MSLLLKHQTAAQFISRVRERYRNAFWEELIIIARWVLNKLESGDITDSQCRNAWNKTILEWTALKTKMQNWVNNYDSVQSAQGE